MQNEQVNITNNFPLQLLILKHISEKKKCSFALIKNYTLSSAEASYILSDLEMKGCIKNISDKWIIDPNLLEDNIKILESKLTESEKEKFLKEYAQTIKSETEIKSTHYRDYTLIAILVLLSIPLTFIFFPIVIILWVGLVGHYLESKR